MNKVFLEKFTTALRNESQAQIRDTEILFDDLEGHAFCAGAFALEVFRREFPGRFEWTEKSPHIKLLGGHTIDSINEEFYPWSGINNGHTYQLILWNDNDKLSFPEIADKIDNEEWASLTWDEFIDRRTEDYFDSV